MYTTLITEELFKKKLENKDGDFRDTTFLFPVILSENFNFPMDFSNSIFEEKVSLVNCSFLGEMRFDAAEFRNDVDFSLATFLDRSHFHATVFKEVVQLKRTHFAKIVHFEGTYFHGDVFFDRTFFGKEAMFTQARFLRDVYFHKTFFGKRADFSYASFADMYTASFFSIKSSYERMDGKIMEDIPPRLIFRYVFFPRKTMFTNVDLSRVIFQNSMVEMILFKDCEFSENHGRACFYSEVAKEIELDIDAERFERVSAGHVRIDFRTNDGKRKDVNIGDGIVFVKKGEQQKRFKVFITERYDARNWNELFENLAVVYPYHDYEDELLYLKQKYDEKRIQDAGVTAYVFKPFNIKKHWENLEDINRQMKKSLEDSKDWQLAGDFYQGEMEAMINSFRVRKEKFVYRTFLTLYGIVSGYCESVGRIVTFMAISLAVSMLLLNQFKPELALTEIIEYSLIFFIPFLGAESMSVRSLLLAPWQNIILLVMVMWYYLLWFFLALALNRKFRR